MDDMNRVYNQQEKAVGFFFVIFWTENKHKIDAKPTTQQTGDLQNNQW